MSQSRVQIERVVRRHAVHGLRQAVSESIVTVRRQSRPLCDARQPVRGIIRIRARAIVQQIAVVVPRVGLTVDARESVRGIVGVGVRDGRAARQDGALLFGQPVANRIIGVAEEFARRVVGSGQAIE